MQTAWRPTPTSLDASFARAERAELTYAEVGASAADEMPRGYAHLLDSTHVGDGRRSFERLGDALLRWDLHRAARMVLATSTATVDVGCTVVNAAPLGPLALLAPCRVVA